MELNPHLTVGNGVAILCTSMACLGLATFLAFRAWRSTAENWAAWGRRWRPTNWNRWPVYGALWRSQDRRPVYYLWQARLLGIAGVVMCLFGVVVGLLVILR